MVLFRYLFLQHYRIVELLKLLEKIIFISKGII